MPVPVRKQIKDYITANLGTATAAELVTACTEDGVREDRVNRVLDRLVTRNVLTKLGDDYSIT